LLILDTTTKKLQVKLGAAGAIPFTSHWTDITTTTFVPGEADGYSDGTNPVQIVAAPAASTERKVQAVTFYNNTGTACTVIVEVSDNGTIYRMLSIALSTGEMLHYTDADGWRAIQTDGTVKMG
jgi:hypothetical protein